MRIALLTDGIFPYVIGGMQKHSFYLAKYFALNEIYVDLYHTNFNSPITIDLKELKCFSSEEKKFIRSFFIEFPAIKKFPGHYISESYVYSDRVFNTFRDNSQVDFIYAKGFSGWKLIEMKKAGMKTPPIGVNFHGYEMFQNAPGIFSKLKQLLLRKPVLYNIKNADYVFSYGGGITDLLLKSGIEIKKIIESPAGIESDWLVENIQSATGGRKFVFVGRYERRKGIQEINIVLKNILKYYKFEFHFVGEIPEKHKLDFPQVKYWGIITDKSKMQAVILNCDVLVCPSYSEGMPNVILEAMSSGLAVIATNVGAVNTMVSSKTGWLIKPGKRKELEEAIINAVELSDGDLTILKQNSHTHIRQNFLMSEIVIKLISNIAEKS